MAMASSKEVTQMLKDWNKGDRTAFENLMPIVYNELRRIAAAYLSRERPGHTLQTTALVHEAYLQLVDEQDLEWNDRIHFFRVAAQIMRRLLVNHALANKAVKRGGGDLKLSLDEAIEVPNQKEQDFDVLALNDALEKLAEIDPRKSELIELRFFAGLSNEEAAEALGISLTTFKREWRMARAWLQCEMEG
jgi:RNA polymerase sigma factor (TIGR02999 family)